MGRAAVTRNSQKKGPSAPSHCQQLERLPENRDKASGRSPWPQRDPAGPEDPGDPGAPAVHPRGVKARTGAESPGDPKTREHRDDTDSRTCALEKTPASPPWFVAGMALTQQQMDMAMDQDTIHGEALSLPPLMWTM
ncbi:uncharacterized protein AAEQ78_003460 isoform 1-T3 [Lycaon pictus]